MPVTLSAQFERLSEALDEAKRMPRREAYFHLRSTVEIVQPDEDLKTWFLRKAAELIVEADDGA